MWRRLPMPLLDDARPSALTGMAGYLDGGSARAGPTSSAAHHSGSAEDRHGCEVRHVSGSGIYDLSHISYWIEGRWVAPGLEPCRPFEEI